MVAIGNQGPLTITAEQAAHILRYHGISKDAAVVLVAIGIAESGLMANNRGGPNSNGSYDWGVWQHNCSNCGDTGPPGWDDPVTNGAWTKSKFLARGFTPWCTWEKEACSGNGSAAYRDHLGTAATAVQAVYAAPRSNTNAVVKRLRESHGSSSADAPYSTGVSGVVTDVGNAVAEMNWSDLIKALTSWETWARFGLGIAGAGLILIAILLFAKEQIVPAVAPTVGRIAKAVT